MLSRFVSLSARVLLTLGFLPEVSFHPWQLASSLLSAFGKKTQKKGTVLSLLNLSDKNTKFDFEKKYNSELARYASQDVLNRIDSIEKYQPSESFPKTKVNKLRKMLGRLAGLLRVNAVFLVPSNSDQDALLKDGDVMEKLTDASAIRDEVRHLPELPSAQTMVLTSTFHSPRNRSMMIAKTRCTCLKFLQPCTFVASGLQKEEFDYRSHSYSPTSGARSFCWTGSRTVCLQISAG
jgi:hypothetical protein